MAPPSKGIIAIYSWKAYAALFVIVSVGVLFLLGWIYFLSEVRDFLYHGAYRTFALFFGSVLYLLSLPTILRFSRRLVVERRKALWVEHGNLVYLDRRFFNVSCSEVASVSQVQERGRGISIVLKSGTAKIFPVGLLAEEPDEILKRLRRYILAVE